MKIGLKYFSENYGYVPHQERTAFSNAGQCC